VRRRKGQVDCQARKYFWKYFSENNFGTAGYITLHDFKWFKIKQEIKETVKIYLCY
jgi:hypothetical protein